MDDQARAHHPWQLGLAAAASAPAVGLPVGARLLARIARPPAPASGIERARAVAVEPVGLNVSERRPTGVKALRLHSRPSIARATARPGVDR